MSDTDVKYYLVNRNTVVNSIFDEIDLELYGEDSEGIILHGKDGTLMNDDNVHVYELRIGAATDTYANASSGMEIYVKRSNNNLEQNDEIAQFLNDNFYKLISERVLEPVQLINERVLEPVQPVDHDDKLFKKDSPLLTLLKKYA